MITIMVKADSLEEAKEQHKKVEDALKCIDTFESGGDIIVMKPGISSDNHGYFSIVLGIGNADTEVEMLGFVQ